MTLYTSDRKWIERYRAAERNALGYFLTSLFLILFGAVYEHFSFGVYANAMIYAFAIPLLMGALPMMLLTFFRAERLPDRLSRELLGAGIATLSAGSLIKGALEIYGTSSPLTFVYWPAGLALIGFAVIAFYGTNRMNAREPKVH